MYKQSGKYKDNKGNSSENTQKSQSGHAHIDVCLFVLFCVNRRLVTGRSHAERVLTNAHKRDVESIKHDQLCITGQLHYTDRQVGRWTGRLTDEQIDR